MPINFLETDNPLLLRLLNQARDSVSRQLQKTPAATNPEEEAYLAAWAQQGFLAQYRQNMDEEIDLLIETWLDTRKTPEEKEQAHRRLDAIAKTCGLDFSTTVNASDNSILLDDPEAYEKLSELFTSIYSDVDIHLPIHTFAELLRLDPSTLSNLFFAPVNTWDKLPYPETQEDWEALRKNPAGLFILNLICHQNDVDIILPDFQESSPTLHALCSSEIYNAIQTWSGFVLTRMRELDIEGIDTHSKKATLDSLVERINRTIEADKLPP